MTRWRLIGLLILHVVAAEAVSALQNTGEVVVVLYSEKDEGTVRLQAELRALGYAPVMNIHAPKSLTSMEAIEMIKENDGAALVNMTMKNKGIEIWISGSRIGRGTLVETIGVEAGQEIDAATILKSVESLRASLMRFDNMNETKTSEQPKQDKVRTSQNAANRGTDVPSQRRIALEGGFSTVFGFSDLTPPVCFVLGAVFHLTKRAALDVGLQFPIYQMTAENSQGSADVWYWGANVGLRTYLLAPKSTAAPWLGAGVGPTLLQIKGKAKNAAYDAHDDLLVVATAYMRIGLDLRVSERIALQLILLNGWSLARVPAIRLGDERIRFGNPYLGGAFSLVVDLY